MSAILTIPGPTWFVGCGNMGGAILDGWRMAELDLSPVTVIRPSGKPVDGVRVVTSFEEAGAAPTLVVLAFKPQKLGEIAPQLASFVGTNTVIISLLAGVEVATLRGPFPEAMGIVRATPNLPVAVRRGVTGLYGDVADAELKQQIGALFVALGFAMWMADEDKLGALGAVAGAGPAYVARFIAALAKAGMKRGLSEEIASTLALETVLGTAWMAASSGESMDSIARRVASPKGTTEAGLDVLDREGVLDQLVAITIEAAARRGSELAQEAKSASLAETPRLS
ncbi:MAG: NAD(P)-binding domain-containing protein [Sphingomonas sp.]|nr:NAD(P)-binding domain-containing protein [Sphingomonas sp.]